MICSCAGWLRLKRRRIFWYFKWCRRVLELEMCRKYPVIFETLGIGMPFGSAVPVWSQNARKIGYWSAKIAVNTRESKGERTTVKYPREQRGKNCPEKVCRNSKKASVVKRTPFYIIFLSDKIHRKYHVHRPDRAETQQVYFRPHPENAGGCRCCLREAKRRSFPLG